LKRAVRETAGDAVGLEAKSVNNALESDELLCAKPVWDNERGELSFAGDVIRKVSARATSVRPILDEFQREGWPSRIDDPLPFKTWYATRIQEACDSLRTNLTRIDFRPDGSGKGVVWGLVEVPKK